jgi:hypothetical protein
MRRKNLRQLQRLLEGASEEGNAVDGAQRAGLDNRTYQNRTYKPLDLPSLTPRAAGWDATALDAALGTSPAADAEGGAANGEAATEVSRIDIVWSDCVCSSSHHLLHSIQPYAQLWWSKQVVSH